MDPDGDIGIDFSGEYTFNFEANCRDATTLDNAGLDGTDLKSYCIDWSNDHPDIDDGFQLNAKLTWKDTVCDPLIFNVQFEATMSFYVGGYNIISSW